MSLVFKDQPTQNVFNNLENVIADNLKVLVFRSDLDTPQKADQIRQVLLSDHRIYRVDVDLEDTDKVLRVECHPDVLSTQLQEHVSQLGFKCAHLP